jgi:outer membrane protein assembly factor BamB
MNQSPSDDLLGPPQPRRGRRRWPIVVVAVLVLGGATALTGTVTGVFRPTKLIALDPRSGAQLWSTRLPVASIGTPTVVDGLAYVFGGSQMSSDVGTIFAVDVGTGGRVWQAAVEEPLCGGAVGIPPDVAGGVAVVGGPRGAIRGLDARTGKELWRVRGTTGPVAGGTDYLVVGGAAGTSDVRALDRRTGRARWTRTFRPDELGPGLGEPDHMAAPIGTATDAMAFVDLGPGRILPPGVVGIVALDSTTGRERWRTELGYKGDGDLWNARLADPSTIVALRGPPTEPSFAGDPTMPGEPTVVGGHYAIEAFEVATGVRRWTHRAKDNRDPDGAYAAITRVWAGPGAAYYFPDGKTLVAADALTGAVRWKAHGLRKDHGLSWSDPAAVTANRALVILTGSSGITALRTRDGTQQWKHKMRHISEIGTTTVTDTAVLVPRSRKGDCGLGSTG